MMQNLKIFEIIKLYKVGGLDTMETFGEKFSSPFLLSLFYLLPFRGPHSLSFLPSTTSAKVPAKALKTGPPKQIKVPHFVFDTLLCLPCKNFSLSSLVMDLHNFSWSSTFTVLWHKILHVDSLELICWSDWIFWVRQRRWEIWEVRANCDDRHRTKDANQGCWKVEIDLCISYFGFDVSVQTWRHRKIFWK